MAVLKNEYEISLWEDLETDEYGYTLLTAKPLDWGDTTTGLFWYKDEESVTGWSQMESTAKWASNKYYRRFKKIKESKLGIIGSDTMTSLSRAIEPCLTQNINGTNTFTFRMYYTYIDTQTGERMDNSWIQYLINEARLKVRWKNKWYDFVIKNRVEDSGGKSVTFTCEDLFVNELSKTGFNLEFDTELENNQGTVFELAKKVLADTDWTLVAPRADETTYPIVDGKTFAPEIIKQYTEEPVYEIYGDYWYHYALGYPSEISENDWDESVELRASVNKKLLLFYSQVENRIGDRIQCITCNNMDFPTDTNSLLVTRSKVNRYTLTNISWGEAEQTIGGQVFQCWTIKQKQNGTSHVLFYIPKTLAVSSKYRAERLVDSQKSTYDAKAQKYVLLYSDTQNNNKKTYGFSKTDYDSSLMVTNCATWDESGYDGWEGTDLYWMLYPTFTATTDITTYKSRGYLRVKSGNTVTNTGIQSHSSFLPDGLQAGYYYHVRFNARTGTDSSPSSWVTQNSSQSDVKDKINITLSPYGDSSNFKGRIYDFYRRDGEYWCDARFYCNKAILKKNLDTAKITIKWSGTGALWITNFQFFQELRDSSENIIYPGDFAAQSRCIQRYYYYYPDDNKKAKSLDDISMVFVSEQPTKRFAPILDPTNSKIRSISIKQSNRFNILQTLAETFQCWVKFGIGHYSNTGEIRPRGSAPELPQKYVTFVNSIGEDKGYGFVYGIDLKTIQRTVQSNQLVTKTIVQQNSNEFGKDGFCTISRATENVPKTNFILNFDYFVANGLLDGGVLANDLYNKANDGIAYYIRLKEINEKYDASLETYTKLTKEFDQQKSILEVYKNALSSAKDELNKTKNDLMFILKINDYSKVNDELKKQGENDQTKADINNIAQLQNNIDNYQKIVDTLDGDDGSIASIQKRIDNIEKENESYVKQIEDLDKAFNSKYARYIQEGSWISEDYMDDDLYYLDGVNVAYTASRPQVQYNVAVLRLTALEEFKNKIFDVGDIGFIEDKEFFGYEIDHITPKKEQIIISQMASYFDSPEKDTITIQNYKTQFEDLFQRITSTTQSLQFARGEYAKTAATINSDGTIKANLLESSLSQNLRIMMNATNESIIQDSTGITIVDNNYPNQQMKLTSGGVIFTRDGTHWTTGIDYTGVRADSLKTGVINTDSILIGPASSPQFKWDSYGINAYAWDEEHPEEGVISSQFVRFDQYGVYGIQGIQNFNASEYYEPVGGYNPIRSQTQPNDWNDYYYEYYIYNNSTKFYQPVKGAIPTWTQNTYYKIFNIPVYELQTTSTEPLDWQNFYNSLYYTYDNDSDDYFLVTGESAPLWEVNKYYKLVVKDPYILTEVPDWQNDYYFKQIVNNVYEILIAEESPEDWDTNYTNYYTYDGENYIQITQASNPPQYESYKYYKLSEKISYVVLKYCPSDWVTNFSTYYIYDGDSEIDVENYISVSAWGEPIDWNENYSNYYLKQNDGVNENYIPVTIQVPLYAYDPENPYYSKVNPPYTPSRYYKVVNGEYQRLDSQEQPDGWVTPGGHADQTIYYIKHEHSGLSAIKDYANFGLTWDGFFIKNRYGTGYVSISSEDDFTIKTYNPVEGQPDIERIKIGNLGNVEQPYFGIRINNSNGNPVLITHDGGDLWLQDLLTVGDGSTSTVKIGYNPSENPQNLHNGAHEVFRAGDNTLGNTTQFVVYEDGYLKASGGIFTGEINATQGTFTGTIHATGGDIGGMSIDIVKESTIRVEITTNNGTTVKNGHYEGKILTVHLYQGATEISSTQFLRQWKRNGVPIIGETGVTYELEIAPNPADVYTCDCIYNAVG